MDGPIRLFFIGEFALMQTRMWRHSRWIVDMWRHSRWIVDIIHLKWSGVIGQIHLSMWQYYFTSMLFYTSINITISLD